MSDENVRVAERALHLLARGFETGDFEPYLAMLTDDFTFWMPTGPFRGKNVGKDRVRQNYAATIRAPDPSIRFPLRYSVTRNDRTVVFEFEDGGMILGREFRNRVAFSMDVRGGEVCAFREYVGDIDLQRFAMGTAGGAATADT